MADLLYYEPFYDFDRFLDEVTSSRVPPSKQLQRRNAGNDPSFIQRPLRPRMDLHEDKERNLVTATFEMPGMSKDNVQIDVNNGRLVVSGEAKRNSEYDEGGYAIRERQLGKFSRTLQLPQGVKDDEIKASMENGILTVTFPKSAPQLAPKKITIA
ncbi:hypothetical protein CVT24_009030 [Panaeolus cyanescens]|uniref:Uncharacterized protein n=1 Tax=Panaeolus cyanescens TaxID=181874 RepID=A0A409YAJ8_9AGAR|nr:hypothetical protein CVT24_009030 [Panaeolus cyanescens]